MKQILTIALLFCLLSQTAQSQQIQFEPLSWQKALGKAKSEHKMLFVEMYTPWCTYCKQMEQSVFTSSDAAGFFNSRFINVRYNALSPDGVQIRKSYALMGFPTLLYLDNNGLVMGKTSGYQDVPHLIANAQAACERFGQKEAAPPAK